MSAEKNILAKVFDHLDRQGPGGAAFTRQALRLIPSLPAHPNILDVGCGAGAQTLALAQEVAANITALDNSSELLAKLKQRLQNEKLLSSVQLAQGSMFDLNFSPESYDVLWSEGAIYIIGFERGLREWQRLVKKGGYIVTSHLSWLKDNIPQQLRDFWSQETEVLTIEENIKKIKAAGLSPFSHFALPPEAWWENFYVPIQNRIEQLGQGDLSVTEQKEIAGLEKEIEIYKKFSSYYGYVFYLMQKPQAT